MSVKAQKRMNQESELHREIQQEVNLVPTLITMFLITLFAIFGMLLLNPTIEAKYPIDLIMRFEEYYELHKNDYPTLILDENPASPSDLIGALVIRGAEAFLQMFIIYLDYVAAILQASVGIRMQLFARFGYNLLVLLLIFIILKAKNMRWIPILLGLGLGFIGSYIFMALLCRILFMASFFGNDYAVISHLAGLKINSNWLSLTNMLTTIFLVQNLLGITWVIFWVIFMLNLNGLSILIAFIIQRVFYRVRYDKYRFAENQTMTSELEEQWTWAVFHIVLSAPVGIGLRTLAKFIAINIVQNRINPILVFCALVFVFYYLNKWLVFELYKFFFNSTKNITTIYKVKNEPILPSVIGSLTYTILICVLWVGFLTVPNRFSFIVELVIHMLFFAIAYFISKLIKYQLKKV